jgi:hypothetical protein
MSKKESYIQVRELAVQSLMDKTVSSNWRKVIAKADATFGIRDVTIDNNYIHAESVDKAYAPNYCPVNDENKHHYEANYRHPYPVCNCGKEYVAVEEREKEKEPETFSQQLSSLLNKFSLENPSNTPDYILAEYLIDCLSAYNKTKVWVDKWHSMDGVPKNERDNGPVLDKPGSEHSNRFKQINAERKSLNEPTNAPSEKSSNRNQQFVMENFRSPMPKGDTIPLVDDGFQKTYHEGSEGVWKPQTVGVHVNVKDDPFDPSYVSQSQFYNGTDLHQYNITK